MCQDALSETTEKLMNYLDDYLNNHEESFSKDGEEPYNMLLTPELTNVGDVIDLQRFTHVHVQY